MKKFILIYTAVIALISLAIYIHDKSYWSGNHWITFNTTFEEILFNMGNIPLIAIFTPIVLCLVISTFRKDWLASILSILSLPICYFSVAVIFFIIGE